MSAIAGHGMHLPLKGGSATFEVNILVHGTDQMQVCKTDRSVFRMISVIIIVGIKLFALWQHMHYSKVYISDMC